MHMLIRVPIEGLFLYFLFVMIFVSIIHFYRKKRGIVRYSLFTKAIMTFYFLLLFNTAILGIEIATGDMLKEILAETRGVSFFQLIPFYSIKESLSIDPEMWEIPVIQLVGNILLLFPLAYGLRILRDMSAKKVFMTCLIIDIGIEFTQMMTNIITRIPSHEVDIDDIILNMFGVVLALLFAKITYRFKDYFSDILFVQKNNTGERQKKIDIKLQIFLSMAVLYLCFLFVAWVVVTIDFTSRELLQILLLVFTIVLGIAFITLVVPMLFKPKLDSNQQK